MMTHTDRRRFPILFAAIAALLALILASLYFPFVAQAQSSTDAKLSNLTVTEGTLRPEFASDTTQYRVAVPKQRADGHGRGNGGRRRVGRVPGGSGRAAPGRRRQRGRFPGHPAPRRNDLQGEGDCGGRDHHSSVHGDHGAGHWGNVRLATHRGHRAARGQRRPQGHMGGTARPSGWQTKRTPFCTPTRCPMG